MCLRAHLRAHLAAQKLLLNRVFLHQPVRSEHECLSDFVSLPWSQTSCARLPVLFPWPKTAERTFVVHLHVSLQ